MITVPELRMLSRARSYAIKHTSLVKERRVGRVHVLGHGRIEHAAPKPDHMALDVADREHESSAEAVVNVATIAPGGQASSEDILRAKVRALQHLLQCVPFICSVTQLTQPWTHGDTALFQILPRGSP